MDVERVIDGLYRLRSDLKFMCAGIHRDYYNNSIIYVSEAINTIREFQSKSEEVCEWRMPNDNADEWTPSCETNATYNVFGVAWFKYCPYCNRKIKVVE